MMTSWRRVRLWAFIISCVMIVCALIKFPLTQSHSLKDRTLGKLHKISPDVRLSAPKSNQSLPKLDKSPKKQNKSSKQQEQSSKKLGKSIRKLVRHFNRSDIRQVVEVFPKDSYPPLSLHRGFLIENAGLCYSVLSLGYIVMVHTAPDNFERRQSMRVTWTKQNIFKEMNSQRIFLLGKTLNTTLQGKIIEENKKYGDIVQGDFIDHYRNLTLKAVMGLKWIVKNCRHAEYVIKVDDDVFVNIFQVNKTIFPLLNSNPLQLVCSVEPKAPIFRIGGGGNKVNDKWRVDSKYFKNETKYPMPFCYGYATFYTTVLATELLNMAYSTPFYRLDDVYVYGMLMSKIKSASWRDEGKRYFKNELQALKNFPKTPNALVGTARSNNNMLKLWKCVSK